MKQISVLILCLVFMSVVRSTIGGCQPGEYATMKPAIRKFGLASQCSAKITEIECQELGGQHFQKAEASSMGSNFPAGCSRQKLGGSVSIHI